MRPKLADNRAQDGAGAPPGMGAGNMGAGNMGAGKLYRPATGLSKTGFRSQIQFVALYATAYSRAHGPEF